MVGDTTLAEIPPKLEKLFAAWKAGRRPQEERPGGGDPPKPVVYLIDRPGAPQ